MGALYILYYGLYNSMLTIQLCHILILYFSLFRFNKETCELICDDLGVAYPIINGIPNLTPEDSRKL